MGEALQAVAAGAVQQGMRGIGRREMMRLPRVGADRLRAETQNAALLDEKADGGRRTARAYARRRRVGWRSRRADASTSPCASAPRRPRESARARAPKLRCRSISSRKSGSAAASAEQSITQAGAMKFLRIDRVDRAVGEIAPGDPMRGRVEMGAGVLAHREIVPVPGRAAMIVVARFPRSGTAATGRVRAAARWSENPGRASA